MNLRSPSCMLLACALTLLAGCAIQPAGFRTPDDARRQASFEPFTLHEVNGEPLEHYLQHYRALLIAGADARIFETENGPALEINTWEDSDGYDFSMAIPLTDDGYFLTAAHSVERRPLRLVLPPTADREGHVVPTRLVWAGQWRSPDTPPDGQPIILNDGELVDVAVIHASTDDIRAKARWAPIELPPGTPVVALGRDQALGGQIFKTVEPRNNPTAPVPIRWLLHDVPVREGDSGGPLMLTDGRVVGMNVAAGVPVRGLSRMQLLSRWELPLPAPWQGASVAVAPDPAAIRALIDADRQRHDD